MIVVSAVEIILHVQIVLAFQMGIQKLMNVESVVEIILHVQIVLVSRMEMRFLINVEYVIMIHQMIVCRIV